MLRRPGLVGQTIEARRRTNNREMRRKGRRKDEGKVLEERRRKGCGNLKEGSVHAAGKWGRI